MSAGTAHEAILDKSVKRSWALPDTMPGLGDIRPNGLYHGSVTMGTTSFDTTMPPIQRGRIPGYTGHLPGVRYSFGRTYGHITA